MLPPLTKLREFWSTSWPTIMVHKHTFCHDWQLTSAGRLVRDLASGCSWVTASPAAPAQEPFGPVSFVLTLCSMCKLYRQHRDHWSRSRTSQEKADFFQVYANKFNLTFFSLFFKMYFRGKGFSPWNTLEPPWRVWASKGSQELCGRRLNYPGDEEY